MARIGEADLILNADGSIYHLGLRPSDVSQKIITVGDPDRVERVSHYFDRVEVRIRRREFVTHTGYFQGKRLTVISTGIGTDNVEIVLTELDALFNIDLATRTPRPSPTSLEIVRVGTSGSIIDIPTGSYVASDFAVGFDNLMSFYSLPATPLETEIGAELRKSAAPHFTPYVVQGTARLREKVAAGMIQGNTVTCPGFFAPQGRSGRIQPRFPALLNDLADFRGPGGFRLTNFEMETAGYYALGRLMGHGILSVSLIVANRPKNTFSANPEREMDILIEKVIERI